MAAGILCKAWSAFSILLVVGCATHLAGAVPSFDRYSTEDQQQRHGRGLKVKFPPYVRGKDKYEFVLNERDRTNGISYYGAAERLRLVVDKLKKGLPVKVATIGGSITAGQGCVDAPNWPQYLFNWVADQYGEKATGNNGAVGGTLSSYMSVCHNVHVPRDADIVFVEYSVNDVHPGGTAFMNNMRRPYERLIRKLLRYPNHPAVVLMHEYIWFNNHPFIGAYWSNAERELNEFALYYNLPSLSVKAAVYHRMVVNEDGFNVKAPRQQSQNDLKGIAFYWDPIHPDGYSGARMTAELAMHLILHAERDLKHRPLTDDDVKFAKAELPPPMIPNNQESISDKCFIGQHFTARAINTKGWEWINESKTPRPKWGFVSTTVGSQLEIKVDTRARADASNTAGGGPFTNVLVELAYLRSYEKMGKALVSCLSGCTCEASTLNGHGTERNSQLHLFNFFVSQHEECVISIKVLPETDSGQNKVKIAGVMISEEVGQSEGIQNHMAVEYVHDISSRAKDNHTFDVMDHARRRSLLLDDIWADV